jgi:hypothetical protein
MSRFAQAMKKPFIVHRAVTHNNKYHVTINGRTTSHNTYASAKQHAKKMGYASATYHDADENVKSISLKKAPQYRKRPSRPRPIQTGYGFHHWWG